MGSTPFFIAQRRKVAKALSTYVRKFDDKFFWTHPIPRQPPKSPEGGLPHENIEFFSTIRLFSKRDRKKIGERFRKRFLSPLPGDLGGFSRSKYVTEFMTKCTKALRENGGAIIETIFKLFLI